MDPSLLRVLGGRSLLIVDYRALSKTNGNAITGFGLSFFYFGVFGFVAGKNGHTPE